MKKEPNLTGIAFGGVYLVLSYFLLMFLLRGGGLNLIKAAAIIMPFVLLWLNTIRAYWVGLFFGFFAFWVTKIPIPLIDAFSFYGLLVLCFVGFLLLDFAMKRERIFLHWQPAYKLMICYAVLITARMLLDPPSSARMGSGGGLSIALPYLLGGWAFPLLYWTSGFVKDWKKTLRLIMVISLIAYFWLEVYLRFRGVSVHDTGGHVYALSFNRELYFIFCLVLTWAGSKGSSGMGSSKAFIWTTLGLLVLSVVSMVRSAPFQALAIIWSVAFVYKRLARTMGITLLVGLLGIGALLAVVPFDQLPHNIQRSVSVLLPGMSKTSGYGELGFESGFRDRLREYALDEIKDNPVAGAGWAFKRQAILEAVSINNFEEARWAKLAMTGSYHNSLLTMAGKNGIVTAVLFLCGVVFLSWKFGWWLRERSFGKSKFIGCIFFAYIVNLMLMMQVNGGPYEPFGVMAALGVLAYLHDRSLFTEQDLI